VGTEGIVTKSAMLRSPETKYKRSKIIVSVTSIALTCAPGDGDGDGDGDGRT